MISSSWKDVPRALLRLQNVLKKYNIECLGCTEKLPFKSNRSHEINHWLKIVSQKADNKFTIDKWIAIDDIDLEKLNPQLFTKDHFVLTTIEHGLTDQLVQECIELLS